MPEPSNPWVRHWSLMAMVAVAPTLSVTQAAIIGGIALVWAIISAF